MMSARRTPSHYSSKANAAYIVGAFEHPTRNAPDRSQPQLYADIFAGVLRDSGLAREDIDGLFLGPDAPGTGPLSIAEYLNIRPRYVDTTNTSGSSYAIHVAHAVDAIRAGRCDVALVMLADRPRQTLQAKGPAVRADIPAQPDFAWETPMGLAILPMYAMCARRHMHEYGTTSEQLAWIRVAASHHASHNPHAVHRDIVTVEDVMRSPVVSDPFHRLDCCIMSDGGGGLILARPEIAMSLPRPLVRVRGTGTGVWTQAGGYMDLTATGAVQSGAQAFAEAGLVPGDIKYASLYDSFTFTVLAQIEDLGFCAKGEGGRFVADGQLIAGLGSLPVNTDGGGLCNNHPGNRGGMSKVIEAVRQVRGEANDGVQVPNCDLALANAIGGMLGVRHASATVILERE